MFFLNNTRNQVSVTTVGSNLTRDFGLFDMRKLSSKVTERRCFYSLVPEIFHGGAPEVFLHQ